MAAQEKKIEQLRLFGCEKEDIYSNNVTVKFVAEALHFYPRVTVEAVFKAIVDHGFVNDSNF